jgi:ABC-2 type transport system ATP-binding protein
MHTALTGQPVTVDQVDASAIRIRGLGAAQIGHLAFEAGVELHELSVQRFDLEELFFALTSEQQEPQP